MRTRVIAHQRAGKRLAALLWRRMSFASAARMTAARYRMCTYATISRNDGSLHALAGHRDETIAVEIAKVLAELRRAWAEWPGPE